LEKNLYKKALEIEVIYNLVFSCIGMEEVFICEEFGKGALQKLFNITRDVQIRQFAG
jgi:hypothetical protein